MFSGPSVMKTVPDGPVFHLVARTSMSNNETLRKGCSDSPASMQGLADRGTNLTNKDLYTISEEVDETRGDRRAAPTPPPTLRAPSQLGLAPWRRCT